MKIYYDFHIHSALSPCGEDDMTPNNIVNMAKLIGLDAIAVCDHNCGANLPALSAVADKEGILFLPGIELSTAEEVHLLAYFNDVQTAYKFGEFIYEALPEIPNNEDFFGHQYVMNENDEIVDKKEKLLISALPFYFDEAVNLIREHDGIAVPAHINKGANSLLQNLGFFPPEIQFTTVEEWKGEPCKTDISNYIILHDSDAHNLMDISERENTLEVNFKDEKSIFEIFNAISNKI